MDRVLKIMSHGEDDTLPPHTLVMDVTMTHDHYGRTTQHTNGTLTHRVSSTGASHVTMTHDRYGRTTQHTNGALTHRVSSTGPRGEKKLKKISFVPFRPFLTPFLGTPSPGPKLPFFLSTKKSNVAKIE